MRIHAIAAGLGVVSLVLAGAIAGAQTGNVPDGKQLYMDNCSICHGVVTTGSLHRSPVPVQVAWAERPGDPLTDGASSLGIGQPERAGRRNLCRWRSRHLMARRSEA
jgi:mono/diheme cytochrome c family protein